MIIRSIIYIVVTLLALGSMIYSYGDKEVILVSLMLIIILQNKMGYMSLAAYSVGGLHFTVQALNIIKKIHIEIGTGADKIVDVENDDRVLEREIEKANISNTKDLVEVMVLQALTCICLVTVFITSILIFLE